MKKGITLHIKHKYKQIDMELSFEKFAIKPSTIDM